MEVRNAGVELRRTRELEMAPRSQLNRGHPKRRAGGCNSERQNVERAEDFGKCPRDGKCQRQGESGKIRDGTS